MNISQEIHFKTWDTTKQWRSIAREATAVAIANWKCEELQILNNYLLAVCLISDCPSAVEQDIEI